MQETGFNLWVGKIPWRRKWQPTWIFLPREFHAQRNLAGYNPWGCKELDMIEHAPCIYFTSIHFPLFVLILLKVYWTTCYNYPLPFETFFFPENKKVEYLVFSSVQSLSRVWLFETPWTADNKPPCQSPTPGVYSNSCPLSWWCHPTISSHRVPFSRLQSFPASGSLQISQLFASSGQSIGVSASASVLLMNIQDWFPLGWTG